MAEHYELIAEMPILEQMGTQERQKLAKKRRLQQLKKWGHREKEWIAKEKQLNKRLASILHEENNGLNLKQYTTYSSNHRSKKKLHLIATGANGSSQNGINYNNNNNINNNNNNNNNNNHDYLNNNTSSLHPNGRVHFNVGVMLLEAAARNDFDEVKRLLMLGVSPDSVNHDGLTALHQCCIDASEPMMNLLLEFGANVDAKDTEQWTPLHAACTCGHLNLVKILVENGANLLAVNGDGNMPFDICEDESTADYIESQMVKQGITQEMIDLTRASTEMQMISDLEKQLSDGLDLDWADENGVTQLHIAAANGYLSVVKFLLKHGVNANVCDNDLWRPLHGAACWGNEQHIKVIELLVEAGAQLDAKTINDESAFDLCDNADLLARLNQLKDELESKQAYGTDRLKRTQSRTNSRVHSVRRTSVRDKNQISRREAREEAMLRVDSSTTSISAAPTTVAGVDCVDAASNGNQNINVPASTTTTTNRTSESMLLSADKNTSETNLTQKTESSTSFSATDQPYNSINQSTSHSLDQVDHKKNNTVAFECRQTDLNEIINSNDEIHIQTTISDNEDASRSQDSHIVSITSKQQQHNSNSIINNNNNNNSNNISTSNNKTSQQQKISTNSTTTTTKATSDELRSLSSFVLQDNQQLVAGGLKQQGKLSTTSLTLPPSASANEAITKSLVIVNGKTPTTTGTTTTTTTAAVNNNGNVVDIEYKQQKFSVANDVNNSSTNRQNGISSESGNDSLVSSLVQQQKQLTQSMVVQSIAPINYTLSNLKKQRSDLRMRTTSIGGGSMIGATTSVIVVPSQVANGNHHHHQHQQQQQHVVGSPDSQSSSNGSSNGSVQNQQQQQQTLTSITSSSSINGHRRGTESPSLTFRKFSGEPSEVIGAGERSSKHKCCILI